MINKSLINTSLFAVDGASGSLEAILQRILSENIAQELNVEKIFLQDSSEWFFDKDTQNYQHNSGKFFSIEGFVYENDQFPIIVQPEIGILGFATQVFDGVLHFLVQLKNEPGNPNGLQLAPTVQATRSNYTQAHGGKKPDFLEYFLKRNRSSLVVADQYQSEQGMRYYRKRNRNMIINISDVPEHKNNYIWMTLGQIKALSKIPMLLNSCARSVLSMIPMGGSNSKGSEDGYLGNHETFSKLLDLKSELISNARIVPLGTLKNWGIINGQISRNDKDDFKFLGIKSSSTVREVSAWSQPLLEESSPGEYGLLLGSISGIPHIFWGIRNEPGLFDGVELGPSWINRSSQQEQSLLPYQLSLSGNLLNESWWAEEGGRFNQTNFHHKIIWIGEQKPQDIPPSLCPLTISQSDEFIKNGCSITIEGRSLFNLLQREWFE